MIPGTVIGVDFDNTLVAYDDVFHAEAVRRGWLSPDATLDKRGVRDAVRGLDDGENKWRRLQAFTYGPGMAGAVLIPGVDAFFAACRRRGARVYVVSHKTRYAAGDTTVDLHASALHWMDTHGFFEARTLGLSRDAVYLELSRADKLARIADLGCAVFVDDLEETFLDPGFPDGVDRFLYDPRRTARPDGPWRAFPSWDLITQQVCGET